VPARMLRFRFPLQRGGSDALGGVYLVAEGVFPKIFWYRAIRRTSGGASGPEAEPDGALLGEGHGHHLGLQADPGGTQSVVR
jgi:hypothetical protein